jgi:prevent-host-death family protein
MNVGVREFKQHLSEYLRRVGSGETIQITDRGVPVALIMPIGTGEPLARGIDEGWIRPPQAHHTIGHGARASANRRVLDVLHEDRGE